MIYAALAGAEAVDADHLSAGLAVWDYCDKSAARIFGDATGDPVADDILRALQAAGEAGMSRNAIREIFDRNQSSERIGMALADLLTRKVVRCESLVQRTGPTNRNVVCGECQQCLTRYAINAVNAIIRI